MLGVSRERLIVDRDLPSKDRPSAPSRTPSAAARCEREPVAYIVGRRGFRRLDLAVDRRALMPRPETELLVEVGLTLPRGARVLDLGTGSGAVALALKDERPDLHVTGSDLSEDALALARANGERLGLEVAWLRADLLAGVPDEFDAILSNPPYVAESERASLAPEILRHEPPGALFSGPDGLTAIRALLAQVADRGACRSSRSRSAPGRPRRSRELMRAAGFAAVRARARSRGDRARRRGGAVRRALRAELHRGRAPLGGVPGRGGVAVFPADTVYGVCCDPDDERAVRRLYELKGRPAERPAAVMFFALEPALSGVNELRRGARGAGALLPGPVTLLLPNPCRRFRRRPAGPRRRHARPARTAAGAFGGARSVGSRRSSRARTSPASRCTAAGRRPGVSEPAPISCSTAASCRAFPRQWSTCANTSRAASGGSCARER